MYFDIALHYHTTIKVEQHEQNNLNTLKWIIIPALHRLPSHIGSGMLHTKVIWAGSNQPWVPHGDNAAQPRSSYRLNAWMGSLGTLRYLNWLTGTARVR